MTTKYFVCTRTRKDGIHIIHKEGCPFLPEPGKRLYLGMFRSPARALEEGKKYCTTPARCIFCSKEHRPSNRMRISDEMPDDPAFVSFGQLNVPPVSFLLCSVN